jgi:UDP-N-acetylglucosamine--N-acetylmuramyl-(pentapeptide) pyrophosphoryl-undecaprenol N-acetylglucosamine transferase
MNQLTQVKISMHNTINNHVLIVAGGTGGHIFPGLAVAKELKKSGVRLSWIGTPRGLENKVVKAADIPLFISSFRGVRGKSKWSIFFLPWRLLFSIFEVVKLIKKIKPDFIACFGGYVTVPVGLSSIILQIPFLVHEQNAIMGSANRLLARVTKKVFLSFKITRYAPSFAKFVGNPLRDSFSNVKSPEQRWSDRRGPLRILILGGSLGASSLNIQVPKILAKVAKINKLNFIIVHQSGEKDYISVDSSYKNLGLKAEVRCFLQNVNEDYAWADLVICRSGAGTVSEIAAVGVGSILIPLPDAIDNHQMLNAQFLSESGAALVVEEKNINGEEILAFLEVADRVSLLSYAIKARKSGNTNPASKIANQILKSMVEE